ncbi:thiamin biosynthesis protein G (chloroplast) [Porphyra umbilicalis]|uniref:Thiazole synthase n=1 Tax=Porphyra umbilicalis TaxID=2786 RepID=J7F9L9_PORUM|nr:thiamin biosynthesis protein G [Porphyra umbilicalis]AFC40029.1 thiamin biosynthesis protein G [Porphyra umbilicalis]ASN78833.1 thiamin biosynthesis protein G [Porphyra umbilicalis]|eukprot:ASN78833.1 thiamin biosynthesis protein G (chloroplast) [Porphyra umbilicalis]
MKQSFSLPHFVNHNDSLDLLKISDKTFSSRLMLGTGKYKNLKDAINSINASGANIVTVAIRRAQNTKNLGRTNLIDGLDWSKLWMLPNTAGCETAEEAVRIASLGREIVKKLGQSDNNFIKLEVIPDSRYLLPDSIGTLKAAEYLINKGFVVMPYIGPDPVLAKQLENIGCATVMPLASPIGSGKGLKNLLNLKIIIENAKIPVIIDAGIGTPSEAGKVMELGAAAVLVNTAIARAENSQTMARAMSLAVQSGRLTYIAGRMPISEKAEPSSPILGISK